MMFVLHLKRQKVPNRERSSIQARYDLGSIPILPYNYAVISTYSIRCFTILATSIGAHSATQSIQHKRSVIRICTTRTSGDRGPCPHWRRSHYDIASLLHPDLSWWEKGPLPLGSSLMSWNWRGRAKILSRHYETYSLRYVHIRMNSVLNMYSSVLHYSCVILSTVFIVRRMVISCLI